MFPDFDKYVYSKSAAIRLTERNVTKVTRQADQIVIDFDEGDRASLDCSIFKEHFAEYRRSQGQPLAAWIDPNDDALWYVSKYRVRVKPDRLTCTCNDWQTQQQIGIKRPTCKHCYAVLFQMGYGKLSEYLEARESENAGKQSSETTSQLSSSVPQLPKIPQYLLKWESYGRDRDDQPLETESTKIKHFPTIHELNKIRKHAHERGFKLVDVVEVA